MNNKWRNYFNQEALCILFHKERWKKTNNDVNDTAYSNETIDTNETMPDSIMLNARGPGAAITTGPIFFPFAFPTCLLFWIKRSPELEVEAKFYVCQPYTIYPQSIRFTDNEGHMMTPTMIERLDMVHKQDITKLDSTAIVQGIKTSGAIRLRWHFRGKQAKKKDFCVSIDAPAINGKDGKPLLIWFRRKTEYEYIPFFGH